MRITIMMHEYVRTVRNVIKYDLNYRLWDTDYIYIKSENGTLIMRAEGIDVIQINEEAKDA